jgi:hypothetical protein
MQVPCRRCRYTVEESDRLCAGCGVLYPGLGPLSNFKAEQSESPTTFSRSAVVVMRLMAFLAGLVLLVLGRGLRDASRLGEVSSGLEGVGWILMLCGLLVSGFVLLVWKPTKIALR